MRKYCRVEKLINGYVVQTGGPGHGPLEQWVAPTLEDVSILLAKLLGEEKQS